ncbi:hypothetical protein EDD85DRAFT_452227 [Armillaria nabsnona]|nr:hypothetical protein EDD85DRAFT_452227 [Armillaria nabsnona]
MPLPSRIPVACWRRRASVSLVQVTGSARACVPSSSRVSTRSGRVLRPRSPVLLISHPFTCTTHYCILRSPRRLLCLSVSQSLHRHWNSYRTCARPLIALLTRLTMCISLRRHYPLSAYHTIFLPSLYHYSYLLLFYPIYPFLFCPIGLSLFTFLKNITAYLANLYISPEFLEFLLVSGFGVLGNIIFPFVIKMF